MRAWWFRCSQTWGIRELCWLRYSAGCRCACLSAHRRTDIAASADTPPSHARGASTDRTAACKFAIATAALDPHRSFRRSLHRPLKYILTVLQKGDCIAPRFCALFGEDRRWGVLAEVASAGFFGRVEAAAMEGVAGEADDRAGRDDHGDAGVVAVVADHV